MKPPVVMEHIKSAHIDCTKEDLAPLVIMPGDPLRAKYIAEKYLSDAKLVVQGICMLILVLIKEKGLV